MAYNEHGTCSECYQKGYWDAFDTIAEHFRSARATNREREAVVYEILALQKEEYSK